MMFSLQLPWEPLDHLELFAGAMSVTRGEWKVKGGVQVNETCCCKTIFLGILELLFASLASLIPTQAHRTAVPMDLEYGEHHDIMTPTGFCDSLFHLLSVRPGGGFFAAPVCSSWVFMLETHLDRKNTGTAHMYCVILGVYVGNSFG